MQLIVCKSCLLLLCILTVNATLYQFETESEILTAVDGLRTSGIRNRTEKDFVLGGLFPIHIVNSSGGGCGDFRSQGGLERMEAMLFALDCINDHPTLLPNITLGFDIRDTCSIENVGLDEALDLIAAGKQLNIESCQSNSVTSENGTAEDFPQTVGIVGPSLSRVSVPVASLGRLFSMPQVSYASTSAVLSNRETYTYFYRTIPPDTFEVQAMIELFLHFNWTFISVVYSTDSYGQSGVTDLRKLAEEYNICIDLEQGIDINSDYQALSEKLARSHATVVVLYALHEYAEKLLQEISNTDVRQRFTWIASSAWAQAGNVIRRFSETTAGMFGTVPLINMSDEFQEYYSQLTIQSNKRNPWFSAFYAHLTNCSLHIDCDDGSSLTGLPQYQQGYAVPFVIDAVYTFAHALHKFLVENCDLPLEWYRHNQTCRGQIKEFNGSNFLDYIANLTFESQTGNLVRFDKQGNADGVYEILNYQVMDVHRIRKYKFQRIGTWNSSVFNNKNKNFLLLNRKIRPQFGMDRFGNVVYKPTVSECGKCRLGEYHEPVQSSCCGMCNPCLGQMYSNDSVATACRNCSTTGEMWGNNPLRGSNSCVASPEVFLSFAHPWSIAVMVVSILGLIVTCTVSITFAKYWSSQIVKSSSREQMIMLLVGIGLSYITAFIYVSPPLLGICISQRILLWLCLSLMFGSLLIKVIRIARVFLQKTTLSRLHCMKAWHQIIFTLFLVLGQMLIVAVSLGIKLPGVRREVRLNEVNTLDTPTVVVTCESDHIVALVLSIVYESALLIIATVLGTFSFKYPVNFNESKCICFCAFSLLVIWVAFIPVCIATQARQEIQNSFIASTLVGSAFAILICFFGPKIFVIFFWKERNSKHFSRQRDCSNQCNSNTLGSMLTIATATAENGDHPTTQETRQMQGTYYTFCT